jgi:beta-glucanase (GH16 family)
MSNTDLLIRPVVNQNTTPPAVAAVTGVGAATIPTLTVTVTPSVVAATTSVGQIFPPPVGQALGVWTGVFRDEFTGTSVTVLDSNQTTGGTVRLSPGGPIWKAWYPNDAVGDGTQHSNNGAAEKEYYDYTALSLDGVSTLTITATNDGVHSGVGLPYTSGLIQSNPSFNPVFGYFECRLKVQSASGSWPAFWMAASSFAWPPEFDIYEDSNNSTSNYEVSNFTSGHTVFGNVITSDATAYHVYGFKWASGVATWYLDGVQVANETNAGSVPSGAMYLLCNLAVNNTNTSTFSMQVDYIRAWQ